MQRVAPDPKKGKDEETLVKVQRHFARPTARDLAHHRVADFHPPRALMPAHRAERSAAHARSTAPQRPTTTTPPPPAADADEHADADAEADARRLRARERARAAQVLEEGSAPRAESAARGVGSDESEDEEDARRARLAESRRRRASDAVEVLGFGGDNEEEYGAERADSGSSSSYETVTDDDEEEDARERDVLLKPVFVRTGARETVRERERAEQELAAAAVARESRLAERREESRRLLVESLAEESASAAAVDSCGDLPDDDDDKDDDEQFERWRARELQRVLREREERSVVERERAEVERRRLLSAVERKREDDEFARQRAGHSKDKVKWGFLQKYYHKGAFFQDEDESGNAKLGAVVMRDYGEATGADKRVDKSALPKPMQVKNFGMRGNTKWTHLSAEDTSSKDALWAADRTLVGQSQRKLAGLKAADEFERPSKSRKRL